MIKIFKITVIFYFLINVFNISSSNEKFFNDEDFVKINNSIFCKSCAHKIINEK